MDEILQELPEEDSEYSITLQDSKKYFETQKYDPRYLGVFLMLGRELFQKLSGCNLFMVGCGAIGYKFLKN